MEMKAVFEKYPSKDPSVIIPLLQDIQDACGYLPEEQIHHVAKYVKVPVSRVFGVATFYNQFRLNPLGKNVIRVCRGTACHVKGSFDILQTLENELNIKAGETTKDLKFTIETVACIGACSIAPVIAVNDEFYGGLTVKSTIKLLKKMKSEDQKN